jgi:hypothetical protein
VTWGYDAYKLQSPEDAGFYRFDEEEEDGDMETAEKLTVEARAYLTRAKQRCQQAIRYAHDAKGSLQEIAAARDALHEAATRLAELQKLGDDLPW